MPSLEPPFASIPYNLEIERASLCPFAAGISAFLHCFELGRNGISNSKSGFEKADPDIVCGFLKSLANAKSCVRRDFGIA